MKTVSRAGASALALLLLSSCANAPSSSSVAAVAGDTATLIADINTAAQGQPLTTDQLKTIAADTSKLSNDVAALNAGTAGTTASSVLTDATNVISEVGAFLPAIEALVTLAAPAPGTPVSPITTKAIYDYHKLKADVAASGKS